MTDHLTAAQALKNIREEHRRRLADKQRAFGLLLNGAIYAATRTILDNGEEACCGLGCCGPCSALIWYRDNAPGEADEAVRAVWDSRPEDLYDWQTGNGGINWPYLAELWEPNQCPNHSPAEPVEETATHG